MLHVVAPGAGGTVTTGIDVVVGATVVGGAVVGKGAVVGGTVVEGAVVGGWVSSGAVVGRRRCRRRGGRRRRCRRWGGRAARLSGAPSSERLVTIVGTDGSLSSSSPVSTKTAMMPTIKATEPAINAARGPRWRYQGVSGLGKLVVAITAVVASASPATSAVWRAGCIPPVPAA